MANIKKGQSIQLTIFDVEKEKLTMLSDDFKDKNFIMFIDHYNDSNVKDFTLVYKKGDVIRVTVEEKENDVVFCSRKTQKTEENFDYLVSLVGSSIRIGAKLEEVIKESGYRLTFKGISLFLPAGHAERFYMKEFENYKGHTIEVEVIKAERRENAFNPFDIVVSRKKILDEKHQEYLRNKEDRILKIREERKQLREAEFENLSVGDIVKAKVFKVEKGFAILNLKFNRAFLMGFNYSRSKVDDLKTVLKEKQEIDAVIIEKDVEKKCFILSVKALTKSNFQVFRENNPVSSVVSGKVSNHNEFGLIIELFEGVYGFLHKSQISYDPTKADLRLFEKGHVLEVKIQSYDIEKERITLSMKALESNEWDKINLTEGQIIDLPVVDVTKRDVTVKVSGVDIIMQNRDVYLDANEPRCKVGDVLTVKVLEFSKDNWILRLNARVLKAQKEHEINQEMELSNPKVEVTIGDLIDQSLLEAIEGSKKNKKGKK